MAYYRSSYLEDDLGEYNPTPYGDSYDSVPSHGLVDYYPSYDSNNYQFFEYNSIPCYSAYNPPHSYSSVAYSTSTFSEPRCIQYDPDVYGGDFNPGLTQFVISYSTVEFNVPEFDDYDPTPYGGGYDIAQNYGKPLPASDEICYPRSMPPDPNAVTSGSIALPSGKEETGAPAEKPQNGSKQSLANEEEQQLHDISDKGLDSHKEEPFQGDGSGYGNGIAEEYGYESYDKPVPEPPSGYGLEAMDLCESLFGYWPCLSREKRRCDRQYCADEGSNSDPWKGTADYLFGSSNPYGERRAIEGCYGDPNYGYERHYQEQPLYRQVYYDE